MDYINVAKFLSIPTAFLISGYSLGFSQNSVPLLYNQPASVSAPTLEGIFYEGAKVVVPGAVIACAGFSYLAYNARSTEERNLYIASAAMVITPQPWTVLVMKSGIDRLIQIGASAVESQKADQTREAVQLLKGWVWQNYVRAALGFAAGAVGFWTHLQK